MPSQIRLSVLERIARASGGVSPSPSDADPRRRPPRAEPAPREGLPPADVDDLEREVSRHVEWIFNTRRPPGLHPPPLDQSILAYGLPDFKFGGADEKAVRDRIGEELTAAVRKFEPRLIEPTVSVDPLVDEHLRMRIHVRAMLQVDPAPLPFVLESRLDLATREIVVARPDDAPAGGE